MDSFNSAYTINPTYPLREQYYKPVVRSESEGNYVHVRNRASRGRHMWELKWEYLDNTNYQSIKDFFDEHQGEAFYWTNPVNSQTYTCIFSDDKLEAEYVFNDRWNITVRLEEV